MIRRRLLFTLLCLAVMVAKAQNKVGKPYPAREVEYCDSIGCCAFLDAPIASPVVAPLLGDKYQIPSSFLWFIECHTFITRSSSKFNQLRPPGLMVTEDGDKEMLTRFAELKNVIAVIHGHLVMERELYHVQM